jgi:hypothetical protein
VLASKSNFTTPQLYAIINDHGVHWGDTGQILARSLRSVASRVALDLLLYWVMCSALYRLTRMAFKMARKAGACFSFVNFMSCKTIVKQPCYGLFKKKLSYTIVC